MLFHSDLFDTHPTYQLIKSMLLDFYSGFAVTEIPALAIEHVISVTAGPLTEPSTSAESSSSLPLVHLRVYTLKMIPTGTRIPRVELTEMGPSLDMSVRRIQPADEDMLKASMRRPKISKSDVEKGLGKKRKNISTDEMGDRVGKIHLVKQDLGKMQGRKMKGLKVRKGQAAGGEAIQED
jgi:ribosome production factor 2